MKRLVYLSMAIVLLIGLLPAVTAAAPSPERAPVPAGPRFDVPADPAPPEGVSPDWWSAVQEQIRASEYDLTWQESTSLPDVPAAYQAPNRAQGLRTYFAPEGPVVIPRVDAGAWRLDLCLAVWGWAGAAQPAEAAELTVEGNRLDYHYPGGLVEWYVNSEQGLEQGFTLPKPAVGAHGSAPLQIDLALDTDLEARLTADRAAVEFVDAAGAVVLRYGDLHAFDATGRALPAQLELLPPSIVHGSWSIVLSIDAAGAAFPITVDPAITGLSASADWTAEGDQADALFGFSVGTAGDVNGDGYADVVVGARLYDNGQENEGRAFVYYGSATGLDASLLWTAESDQAGALFGYSVGTAGDVNGDGYADVVIGAPEYKNDLSIGGRAFVYYGSATGLDASVLWTADTPLGGERLGVSVGTAGDVNGDGYADVIVGAPYYSSQDDEYQEGRAFVYYGSATGLDASLLWTADTLLGGERLGVSVGTAGDVNGDGYADVIVGAPYYGDYDEGRAFVYYGSATGLDASLLWTAESDQAGAQFGYSVGTAGDVDGDGHADVVVGAPWYIHHVNDQPEVGRAFVYHGSASGLSASAAWSAGPDSEHPEQFGASVGTAGDVNGDGYADIIVGARLYDNGQENEGRAFVYHGSASGLGATAAWTAEGDQAYAQFGYSVGTAGDVNGDGYADVVVGAPYYDNGQGQAGRAFVYHGSASGLGAVADWTAEGDQVYVLFGNSVGTAGDVNGDGYADVIVGANYYDNGQENEGRAFVYHGSASGLSQTDAWFAEGDQAEAYFGDSVGTAGDVNGDGYADVVVGAPYYDNGELTEGRAFVYYGSDTGLSPTAAWTAEGDKEYAKFGTSVGTAGDVDGDGYADVIVGAPGYGNDELLEGRAFVYHGSALGLSPTADWTAEGDQVYVLFGNSVGTAGDVNGDGYADVIVGAYRYDNGQTDEGRAFVYHGSASGLSATAVWTAESDQAGASFGDSVGTAGDVDGDGYSDVVVGAPYYVNGQWEYGRAFVYHGSASGLSQTDPWFAEGDQAEAYFGDSVGTAGDVNGDGYADVVVGAPYYDNGELDEGRAFVYHGSAWGLSAAADWTAEGDQRPAWFGNSVGTAGDVNGDGYADVIVGASLYNNGQDREGRAFLYYGNASDGLEVLPLQRRAGGDAPVAPGGQSISPTEARLAALARTPAGRSQVRLEWEVKPEGAAFDGSGLGQSAWQDSGTAGYAFDELLSNLAFETRYHWRLRIVGRPANAAANSAVTYRSRWLYGSTFFTALSGEQAIGGTGQTSLLGQAAYVDVGTQGTLTGLTLRGYPQTAHPHEADHGGGSLILDRYFTLAPNGGASGYNLALCLNYDDAELGDVPDETDLQLCRWADTEYVCLPRSTASDTTQNLACADNVTELSDWVIGSCEPASIPVLTGISPASAEAGGLELSLAVSGSSFASSSVVRWNGADLATTYVSDSQLAAVIPAAHLATVQTAQITVYTPAPSGETSDVLAFFVTAAEAGVTDQKVADGTDPSASVTPVAASATGEGLLVVAEYDANPGGTPSFTASGTYFDVYTAPDSSFSQVTITACGLGASDKLFWWDGTKWVKASPQTYDATTGCVTLVVDASSSPTLSQLQGTIFAVGTEPNTAPVADPGGPYLAAINTAIAFDGSGSDDADGDPLTYLWDFDDDSTGMGATPAHSYTTAGIYDVCLTVNDGTVDSPPACTIAVAYDPSAGFVTGGGWIDSPAGAYTPDPSLSGKATFGFVSKYKKGASVPEGNTEFQFQAGGFNFHSETYEWLVVNQGGKNAQFKGSGTMNGGLAPNGNEYRFMIWAGDDTLDTLRIRIWWEADGVENDVYDNGFEGSGYETGQPIGGGSIVVHTK